MKTLRHIWRGFLARWFPSLFVRWVNRDRCYIQVNNDPSGRWYVRIGIVSSAEAPTLGKAMYAAYIKVERDPDFIWACDYLRELK